MSIILQAQPEFYAIIINEGQAPDYAVSLTKVPIIAWNYTAFDSSATPVTEGSIVPIMINGEFPVQYIAHPESHFIEVATNKAWTSEEDFVKAMQDDADSKRGEM